MWRKLLLLAVAGVFATSIGCTGGGDDDDDDDDDDGGGTPVTGTVFDEDSLPQEGADVEDLVSGESDTTDAAGEFSLLLASNEEAWIRRTATDYYPFQFGLVVPPGGVDITIGGPSNATVAQIEGILGATVDDGILATNLSGVGSTGGFMVTISGTADGSFVFAPGGAPVAGNTTQDDADSTVIYYNVAPGTSTISVDGPGTWTCTPSLGVTNHQVDAQVITQANFDCEE